MDTVALEKFRYNPNKYNLPFLVLGTAAFGSRVKDYYTANSDMDLLIVASGISLKRHRRGEEISKLKQVLPPLPLDILLLTKEEVLSNFRNHNPLFLDIAVEGIVLYDTDSFLENIIRETVNYIEEKNIRKIEGGWAFQVNTGVPTFLSKVSNEDFSKAMLKDGERDFEAGKKLKDGTYFEKSVYHFQQTVEKFIKGIMICMGIFKKTHFVGEELRKLAINGNIPEHWKERLLVAAQISDEIEPEVTLSRYPNITDDTLWLPFEEYEETDALKAMLKAEEVHKTAEEFIKEWFERKPNDK